MTTPSPDEELRTMLRSNLKELRGQLSERQTAMAALLDPISDYEEQPQLAVLLGALFGGTMEAVRDLESRVIALEDKQNS